MLTPLLFTLTISLGSAQIFTLAVDMLWTNSVWELCEELDRFIKDLVRERDRESKSKSKRTTTL